MIRDGIYSGKDIPPHLKGIHHKKLRECPNIDNHLYGPEGYLEHDTWADKMIETHDQKKCQCGFYVIWEKQ